MRIHILCEGPTEESFVNGCLAPHLLNYSKFVTASCVITSRTKHKMYKGGLSTYGKPQFEIMKKLDDQIKQNDFYLSTMFDFYGLPNDFPDYAIAQKEPTPYQKIEKLERAFATDIDRSNFIPYIQLHEFEALLLVESSPLDMQFLEHQTEIEKLMKLKNAHEGNTELINGGKETAPSKMILKYIPAYGKVKIDALMVDMPRVETLKLHCPHFKEWVEKLENL